MIKKYILIIFASFLSSCSTLPLSNSIDSSINTADRHIWIPPDENDLEQRRILQSEFDKIEQGIEVLFMKSKILDSDEIDMRAGIKKVFPNTSIWNSFLTRIVLLVGSKEEIDLDKIRFDELMRLPEIKKSAQQIGINSFLDFTDFFLTDAANVGSFVKYLS